MSGLKVLITNLMLEGRTGTELFVQDIARGLLKAGHRPVLYSPRLGKLAEEIRKQTIPVVNDLSQLATQPDIIHGQHANETLTALLHFGRAPAIYFCHDWYFADDYPPRFPRILRYVAVDDQCYDKLVCEYGVPEERAQILCQFVDLERFVSRSTVLPATPRRAAILCNHTKENDHLKAARQAGARRGLMLDVYGAGVGRVCEQPEVVLRDYDIVFAKGRAALEAAAAGAAVVVYWWRRLGPMVRASDFEQLRANGFGVRSMSPQLTPEEFGRAIERALEDYDASDAAEVSRLVRAEAGRDVAIADVVQLYQEVIAEHATSPVDYENEGRAAAAYVRDMSVKVWKQRQAIFNSTTFRMGERLRRTPGLGTLARSLARSVTGRRSN